MYIHVLISVFCFMPCIYVWKHYIIYLFISFIGHNIVEIFTSFKSKGDSVNGTTRPMLGATRKLILIIIIIIQLTPHWGFSVTDYIKYYDTYVTY